MKKLAVLAVAAMLVFGAVGQAAAFFEDLNLIRSIYTTTGSIEVGTDLGLDVSTFRLTPTVNPINEQRNPDVLLSAFDGGLNTLVVGYWAHNSAAEDFYATGFLTTAFGGTDLDGLKMLASKQSTADGIYNATQTLYAGSGTANTIVNPKTTLNSYYNKFEVNSNAIGSMGANLKNDSYEMTLSLAALSTFGYVDQLLYYFDYNNSRSEKAGVEVAVIRTFLTSDGSTINLAGNQIATVINPSAVPIPGSVLLLASGLLGIFGFRRKKA